MKLYSQLKRYLRQNAPTFVIPKGGLVGFGDGDMGIIFPGTDGQAPVYLSSATLGITAGNVSGGTPSAGATSFDLIAPAATHKGQLLAYSSTTWGALPAPPADGYGLVSSGSDPLGWVMVPFDYLSIPTTNERLALEVSSPPPSSTNLFLLSSGIGATSGIVQAYDGDLVGLTALSNGFVARTQSNGFAARILNPGAGIVITFTDGVSGNPTISLSASTTTGGTGGSYGREVYKPADTGRVNNTIAADPDLNIGAIRAGLYEIEGAIAYSAHASADVQATLNNTVVAGVTLAYMYVELKSAGMRARNSPLNLATGTPTGPYPNQVRNANFTGTLWIMPGVTGDVFVSWAQTSLFPSGASTLHRGSWLRATPLILY